MLYLLLWACLLFTINAQNVTTFNHLKPRDFWNDRQILEDLLKRYRFPDISANVSVGVQLLLERILPSPEEECHLQLLITQKWMEPKLRFENLREAQVPMRLHSLNYVWNPELVFANALTAFTVGQDNIFVYPNGMVEFEQRYQVSVRSISSLAMFPFESKNCSVIFTNADVRAVWSQFLHTQISKLMKLNSGEWHLNNITHHKNKELRFSLKRSTTHWLLVLYIPSLAFLASSWFALWFYQPGDKRQVLVNSLALLGVIVIGYNANQISPRTTFLKAIDVWSLGVLATVLFADLVAITIGAYKINNKQYIRRTFSTLDDSEKRQWLPSEAPYYAQLQPFHNTSAHVHKFIAVGLITVGFGIFCVYYGITYVRPYHRI